MSATSLPHATVPATSQPWPLRAFDFHGLTRVGHETLHLVHGGLLDQRADLASRVEPVPHPQLAKPPGQARGRP